MWLKGAFVVVCLLVFFDVAYSETEREEINIEGNEVLALEKREWEEAKNSVDVKVSENGEDPTIDREKRHALDVICGGCHTKLPQPPCHYWKRVKVKRHCGWWRRRHTCYKWRLRPVFYCCKNRRYSFLLKMCIPK